MISKIHIVNGPNLNLLGRRQPEIYGGVSFEEYLVDLKAKFSLLDIQYFQSNHEGSLIDYLQEHGYGDGGIVMNAGAYTHTSIAIADAIAAISAPVVEVHISDIYAREEFRHVSYMKANCIHSVVGKGLGGYEEAIAFLLAFTA